MLKAIEKIKKERNFSANVIASVPDSLIVLDRHLRINKVNISFQNIFGIKPENAAGIHITDILGDKDGKLTSALSQLIGTKTKIENFELPYRSEKFNKRVFNISARGIVQVEKNGNDYENGEEILIVIEDITSRKQAEQALQQSEELYRTMIEHSNDMIWTLDTKGNFVYINQKSEEITGHKIEEAIGKTFEPLILKEDLEMVEKVFIETLNGKPQTYEVRIHDCTGTKIITLSVNTAPIKKAGSVIGTVSFGRDITQRKNAENEIKRRMSELETFNKLAVGREMRMIDLKKEINEILKKTGKEPKYKIAE